jgi:hypothetical protein
MVLLVVEVMHRGLRRRMAVPGARQAKALVPMMIPMMKVKVMMAVMPRENQVEHLMTLEAKAGGELPSPTLCSPGHRSNLRRAAPFFCRRRLAGNSSIT